MTAQPTNDRVYRKISVKLTDFHWQKCKKIFSNACGFHYLTVSGGKMVHKITDNVSERIFISQLQTFDSSALIAFYIHLMKMSY